MIKKVEHIGFIMDGNRRFSKKHNISLDEGYKQGMLIFYEVLKWQIKQNIPIASFFALSLDNSKKRENKELETIKTVAESLFNKELKNFCIHNMVKINLIGRYFKNNLLCEETIKLDKKLLSKEEKEQLKNQESFLRKIKENVSSINQSINKYKSTINIYLLYDGQEEIASTCKRITQLVINKKINVSSITPQFIKQHMYNTLPPPQIIVRTGDSPRISGFMLYDSAYSELYLSKKLWPELDMNYLDEILVWYSLIKRNFGK